MDKNEIKRVVIVHVHMFKNAGSTFDWSLKKNLGKDFVDHRDDDNMRKGARYLGPYLEEKKNIKAISSHHIRLPLPEINGIYCLPVFILRHPIDRIGSVYAFAKKQKSDTIGAIKAKELSFGDYVRWFMDTSRPATIRDFQTRYCSGNIGYLKYITEKQYESALRSLRNTPLVGIVELYDESMVLFEQSLKIFFPSIDLSYKKQNIGKRQAYRMEERIMNIAEELGKETMNLVMKNNKYDFMLYDKAKEMLLANISNIPDFDEKLKAFREKL